MAAPLDNQTVIKNDDFIAEPAGGKAVADVNSGFLPYNLIEFAVNLCLGNRVESRGWLVENDKRSIFIKCPGESNRCV